MPPHDQALAEWKAEREKQKVRNRGLATKRDEQKAQFEKLVTEADRLEDEKERLIEAVDANKASIAKKAVEIEEKKTELSVTTAEIERADAETEASRHKRPRKSIEVSELSIRSPPAVGMTLKDAGPRHSQQQESVNGGTAAMSDYTEPETASDMLGASTDYDEEDPAASEKDMISEKSSEKNSDEEQSYGSDWTQGEDLDYVEGKAHPKSGYTSKSRHSRRIQRISEQGEPASAVNQPENPVIGPASTYAARPSTQSSSEKTRRVITRLPVNVKYRGRVTHFQGNPVRSRRYGVRRYESDSEEDKEDVRPPKRVRYSDLAFR